MKMPTFEQMIQLERNFVEMKAKLDHAGAQRLIENFDRVYEIARGENDSASFKRDMRKEGWNLLEDVPRRINSVSNLELVPFLKSGESSTGGEELVVRARGELNANYGQHDAEFILEHQEEIPVEFRKYYLVFTGTVWEDSDGDRDVAFLNFNGRRWILDFYWLDTHFHSVARLVRPRK